MLKRACISLISVSLFFSSCDLSLKGSGGVNKAPLAAFTAVAKDGPRQFYFDPSSSIDPEGKQLQFTWDFGDGLESSSSAVFHTFRTYGTFTVKLRVTDDKHQTDTVTRLVNVLNTKPEPSFTIDYQDGTVYLDASESSDRDDEFSDLTFSWQFGDESPVQQGVKVSHVYALTGDYQISLTVKDSFGAQKTIRQRQLVDIANGNHAPSAEFTSEVDDKTVSFDASLSVDADDDELTYLWDLGDGSISDQIQFTHTYEEYNAQPYLVSLTVTDSVGNSDIYNKSVAVFSSAPVIDTQTNTDTNTETNTNTDSSTITDTSTNTQTDTRINQMPEAAFELSLSNRLVSLDASDSVDLDGDVLSYTWDFGDDSVSQTSQNSEFEYTYSAPGSYTITLIVDDGQPTNNQDRITQNVTVINTKPVADFNFVKTDQTVEFSNLSQDMDGDVLTYLWTFGDEQNSQENSPIHAFSESIAYEVSLTVTDSFGDQDVTVKVIDFSINESPNVKFELVQQGYVISLDASATTDPENDAMTYSWSMGESTMINDVISFEFIYDQQGEYIIELTVSDDQGNSALVSQEITIALETLSYNELSQKMATDVIDGLGCINCHGESPMQDNNLSFADVTPVSLQNGVFAYFELDFNGDIHLKGKPNGQFTHDGGFVFEFLPQLRDYWFEYVDQTKIIWSNINRAPVADFVIANQVDLYVAVDASSSYDENGDSLSYQWVYDNQTLTGRSAILQFSQAGTFDVILNVSDAEFTSSKTQSVTVTDDPKNTAPRGIYSLTPNDLNVNFDASDSDDAQNDPLTFVWDIDGVIYNDAIVDHAFAQAGTYAFALMVSDGNLTDSVTGSIQVTESTVENQAPLALLEVTLEGSNLLLNGSGSTDPEMNPLTYVYSVDGQTYSGVNATHPITQTGSYEVQMTVTDDGGLTDQDSQTIIVEQINHPPVARFVSSTDGFDMHLDASTSSDEDDDDLEYIWQFNGQNPTGVIVDYTFKFANTYAVKLTVRDEFGLEDTITKNVSISAPSNYKPIASFVMTQNFMNVSLDATMSSDQDGEVVSYRWFIDGKTFNGSMVDYTFNAEGTYTISLTVEDDGGKTDSFSEDVMVMIDQNANEVPVAVILTSVQAGQYILFNGQNSFDSDTDDTLNFTWILSTGDVFYGSKFYYEATNTEEITAQLTVSDAKVYTTENESITPNVGTIDRDYDIEMFEMASITSCASTCHTDSHPFINRNDMTDWDSDFREQLAKRGATSLYEFPTGQSGGHEGNNAIGTDNWEKWQNLIRLVEADMDSTKNQPPVADFDVSVTGDTVTVINKSFDPENATLTYLWEFGDFETQTQANPTHTYVTARQYVIKLTVDDGYTTKYKTKLVDINF
ncbi:PKD domain-containing protein [Marinicellulosiphila megalodicopiae]|uniref:PKD domain-containing protein n=1 Tax=Marinicellulosiphila megalodicopiae TaxID=2724896 RepID=UPI003BB21353